MTKRSEPPFTEEQIEFWGLLVERLVSRALKASQENTDPLLSADSAGANQSGEHDLLPVMLEHTTAEPGYLSGVCRHFHRGPDLVGSGHQAGCWANSPLHAGPSREKCGWAGTMGQQACTAAMQVSWGEGQGIPLKKRP